MITHSCHKHIFGHAVKSLKTVSQSDRQIMLTMAPTEASLSKAEQQVNALRQIEFVGFSGKKQSRNRSIRIGAWNLQHCHFPEATAQILDREKIDLALLTELDVGVSRSNQRHTIAEIAGNLGYGYGFAVEFLELSHYTPTHDISCSSKENQLGFHGNGFTSHLASRRPVVIRLNPEADWFINPRRGQKRIGGRVGVAATFCVNQFEFVAVSVHLESDTDSAGRGRQMQSLLSAIEKYADQLPVIIGGDFNTGAGHPGFDYSAEALFDVAKNHHFNWTSCNSPGPTSRISPVDSAIKQNIAHYDWFFTRGLSTSGPSIVAAIDGSGNSISDHELIVVTLHTKTNLGDENNLR